MKRRKRPVEESQKEKNQTTNRTERNEFGLPNIVIPAEIIYNDNLTWREKALFGFIQNLTANEYGYCWASNHYLSKHIKVRPETISAMISKLHKEGYLIILYETRCDGAQVRKISIDLNYHQKYKTSLQTALSKILSPLKQNLKTPKDFNKDPLSKTLSKLDNKLDNELGINSLLHKDGVSSKHLTSINKIISFWNNLPRTQKHSIPKTDEDKITKTYKTISLHIDNLLSGKPLVRNKDNFPSKPYKKFLAEYKIPSALHTMTWTEKDIIDMLQIFGDTQADKSAKMSLSSVFWNNFAKIRGGGFSWFIHTAAQTDMID